MKHAREKPTDDSLLQLEQQRLQLELRERMHPVTYLGRKKESEVYFKDIINQRFKTNTEVLEHIINPFSGYVLCDYYLGTEVSEHRVGISLRKKIDLLNNRSYEKIRNNSIVMVQANKLHIFVQQVMPKLKCNIILITGQWTLPQVTKSDFTDTIIADSRISHWFSQNPLYDYEHEPKYHVFPYGMKHENVLAYYNFLLEEHGEKKKHFSNLYCSVHKHLPVNHIRKMHSVCNAKKKPYYDFLKALQESEFVVSTAGDRPDCYRHYECIGLNTIPVSDISFLYKRIFGDNMLYFNRSSLLNAIASKTTGVKYHEINRDLITTAYWREWVNKYKHFYSPI